MPNTAQVSPKTWPTPANSFYPSSLTFSFQRGWEKETEYAEVLERSFERDRMLTYTAHGPHKADFRIRADGAPVEDTLSRGQLKP